MRSKPKKLLTILFSFIVLLLALEVAVRIWAPQEIMSDVMVLGKDLCHQLKKNTKFVQRSKEFYVESRISSQGLRDVEYFSKNGTDIYRVLVLGDSHTFGWGVDDQSIFPKVLQRRLNSNGTKIKYEVINTGTMGYGTGHEYQFLKNVGLGFKPDLVLIAMDWLHDIENNNNYYTIQDLRLIRNSKRCWFSNSRTIVQYIPGSFFLRENSQLFKFAGIKILSKLNLIKSWFRESEESAGNSSYNAYDLTVTKGIFNLLKEEIDALGIKLAVVLLPEMRPYNKELLRSFEQFLTIKQFDFVSLIDKLDKSPNSSDFTFARSPHFNSKGHRFLAEQMEKFLKSKDLVAHGFTQKRQ